MTLEELADLPADKLIALSDAQLDEILKPFYNVTRPEQAPKPQRSMSNSQPRQSLMATLSPEKQKAMQMLAAEGMDLSFLRAKKKK